jgi:hypothetical protein
MRQRTVKSLPRSLSGLTIKLTVQPNEGGFFMMNALPDLVVIWAIFTGLFLSLLAYNSTISRYEEGQLFLDESKGRHEQTQFTIVNRINKVIPYIKVTGVLAAVMTVLIITIYTMDSWQVLHP